MNREKFPLQDFDLRRKHLGIEVGEVVLPRKHERLLSRCGECALAGAARPPEVQPRGPEVVRGERTMELPVGFPMTGAPLKAVPPQ